GRRALHAGLVLAVLAALVLALGATPPIVRLAIVLAALVLGTIVVGLDAWSALALGVIASLAHSPAGLGDVAFQLPFAAIAASIRTAPALGAFFARHFGGTAVGGATSAAPTRGVLARSLVVRAVSLALAVAIGTAPLVARLFERPTLGSLFADAVVIPLAAGIAAPLALVGALAGLALESAAAPFTALAALATSGVDALAAALALHEPLPIPTPTMLECLLFYGASMALAARPSSDTDVDPARRARRTRASRGLGILALAGLCASMLAGVVLGPPRHGMRVSFLPVSSGHAVTVEGAAGEVVAWSSAPRAAGFDLGERAVANHLHLRRVVRADAILSLGTGGMELARALELARQVHARELWVVTSSASASRLPSAVDGVVVRSLVEGRVHTLGSISFVPRVDAGLDVAFGATTIALGPRGQGRAAGLVVDGPAGAGERRFDTHTEGLVVFESDGARVEARAFRAR
ncbi:ComEC/Rec2 family competence protein, partial [Myxococcota bacterium]|nr:ComEC/Rec2 family competence protein [Myxococcota bacterium]